MWIEAHDPEMASVVADSAKLERLASGFEFTEGPVWNEPEGCLIFSDIPASRMYRWSPPGPPEAFREPSNKANGNVYDHDWRLVTCEHATSRLVRAEHDGTITVLAERFHGRELNCPNDVVVSADGSLYFSDPTFGRSSAPVGVPRELEQEVNGVYRVVPGEEPVLVADDFQEPNGLCFSPDGELLYINDSARGHIRVFSVAVDGMLSGGEVFASPEGPGEGNPDGMKTDVEGRVYCTGPGGIHVFAPNGRCIGVIRIPEVCANFTWGGDDRRQLFACASTSLYRMSVLVPGNVR